ncbi:lipoyl(octanoyl) transferase LipB [Candidatus Xianfuyuplasma coldseepsis]|uniref:Octanoyltransferase n=1 Tax=Candidatus Xianfuyuplasma coldseepsis TaxID=2782163 RepID=A0A7L7KPU0_9MOLU|nr:lipoyl(octanoyl) transferase LipB [Xianfuyuplasma coldseepsis]QMS84697.1 lipoyl(octanoyl) transferase LipB [Xianfuyuplasma coldseepsis]
MAYKVIQIKEPIGYQEALDIQMRCFDMVDQRQYDGILLILEHKPVLTMGIRTDPNNLLVSKEYLETHGVELYRSDRGGDITFHGPGQIVAYPILRFRDFGLRLSDYMHQLEAVIIDTLATYNITGYRKDAFPGVWVDDTKICAIGVHAKRFITYHGLAFNVTTNKSYFDLINPCGITDYTISSMSDFYSNPNMNAVKQQVIDSFSSIFDVTFEPTTFDQL